MAPPASVDLIGSYPLGTCSKPRVTVDIAVTIPVVSLFLHFLFYELNQHNFPDCMNQWISVPKAQINAEGFSGGMSDI